MNNSRRHFLASLSIVGTTLAAAKWRMSADIVNGGGSSSELPAPLKNPPLSHSDYPKASDLNDMAHLDLSVADNTNFHPLKHLQPMLGDSAHHQPSNDTSSSDIAKPLTVLNSSTVHPDQPKMRVGEELGLMNSALSRLARLQNLVGYGYFNLLGWDDALKYAKQHSKVGEFSAQEIEFIEKIFAFDAEKIGFYGEKVVDRLDMFINKSDVQKVANTGHFLFKGEALDKYTKIRQKVGDSIVLTSGIRSIVKQIYLFLNKTRKVGGDFAVASYSLAPPGYSYHAVGDFDVGKVNFGLRNFTEEFAKTDEFKKLSDLGFIDIRYLKNNPYGVRYEPWHIKVS